MMIRRRQRRNMLDVTLFALIFLPKFKQAAAQSLCDSWASCSFSCSVSLGLVVGASTLCSKKSDAKVQITVTTAYLIRIKYPLSGFDYHLSHLNVANFNKIYRTVSEQQLF